jgi:glycosyltransferase involved in cell wall biosynthesis
MEGDIHERSRGLPDLSLIHWGSFSGTVRMIESSFRNLVDVEYHDLGGLTRIVELMPARVMSQARSVGQIWPWYKTGGWSAAIQRYCLRSGWIRPDRPTLFFQTLAAPVLEDDYSYAIYTDRVAREGALATEAFRSTWGPGWIEREETFLRGASAVFVMGPSTKDALASMYGVDPALVHVVGAGPGTEVGPIASERRSPRRILFVGTDWNLKGGPQVVEAFAMLKRRHPDLELLLVGSEPTGALPEDVQALGRVPREQMPKLFDEADLFVVPTYMEALGYSLLESLMHGLPSIGSNVGNQGWLIGDAGLTVPPGDVNAIADAVEHALGGYDRYKEQAVKRAAELRATMTWDSVAGAIFKHLFP